MDRRSSLAVDDLITVLEAAQEFEMGESTAWLLIKRHDVPRFRRPGQGKRTFIRRGDFEEAYQTPVPVVSDPKKAAA
jgi:hypothetical protein